MSNLDFVRDDRVRDDACQIDGTYHGTWTSPSGAVMAVVRFDGEETRESVDPQYLRKIGAAS